MRIGVARTSTAEQVAGLEAQERDLRAAGCEKLFSEQISASARQRPQLEAAIDFVRQGDVLVVTKPDRLARSVADLLGIVSRLETKGVGLLVLSMGGAPVDTTTPTGRLTLVLLGAVAEFEKNLMLERQREGIARGKAAGKYRGRAPTAMAKSPEIFRLHDEGIGAVEIAQRLKIGRASVYRILGTLSPTELSAAMEKDQSNGQSQVAANEVRSRVSMASTSSCERRKKVQPMRS